MSYLENIEGALDWLEWMAIEKLILPQITEHDFNRLLYGGEEQ